MRRLPRRNPESPLPWEQAYPGTADPFQKAAWDQWEEFTPDPGDVSEGWWLTEGPAILAKLGYPPSNAGWDGS